MPAFSHCFLKRFIATSNGSLSRTLITGIRAPPTRQSDSSRVGSSLQAFVSELLWSPDDRLCRIRLADLGLETWFENSSRGGKNYRKDEHFPGFESGDAS